ncbi:hypothetical protein AB0M50_30700 [Nonomuraea fuscirosea]|jgi:release factor glutamine methyltransferase|uniref:hypothetical protein n=1 Tax=Nonomuraea fuscirosea TaxID=1291556 RepID=UPI002DDA0A98|nr:hypothetical protein [Nonomuraea fuscirosea]WSA52324.1 hypothetical protein OIE67_51290 [Nonomuraea fuscirosea]
MTEQSRHRPLMSAGTSGDLEQLRSPARAAGFGAEVVAHRDLDKEGWRVDHYTFLMRWVTPGGELD